MSIIKQALDRIDEAVSLALEAIKIDPESRPVRVVRFEASDGESFIIHPSTYESGRWQLSWFDKGGDPYGHSTLDTMEDAIKSACGKSGSWGPPHGSPKYRVTEIQS